MNCILRAWILLVATSAATTAFALFEVRGTWAPIALLALTLLKSRIILSEYLHLMQVPPVRRGFTAVLALWTGVALALYVAAHS
ncbi:MAG: cytochrome C oxidase subunit IV family protein [Maritimibacter sp.]|nr:cytochrome C oxidase subunit IV family protein [Maritimibacter sp.]